MDDFIGAEFVTPKGSTLTVVGHNGLKSGKKKYILECSVCSRDEELWPHGSIQIRKGDIIRGKFNCGCATNTYYTEEQQVIRCKRVCSEMDYKYIGLDSEYTTAKDTYVNVVNNKTGNPVKCRAANLSRGVIGDKKNANKLIKERFKSKRVERTEVLNHKFKGVASIRLIGDTSDVVFSCLVCKQDVYTKNGLCNGELITELRQVERGYIPCRCNGRGFLTFDQKNLKVKLICDNEGISLDKFWDDNGEVYMSYICQKGNLKITNYHNFITGKRCSCCAGYGFDGNKSGSFYLVKWSCKGFNYLKYGITNNEDILERVNIQQNKTDGGEYEVLNHWRFCKGSHAEDLEDLIDYYFRFDEGVNKNIMPDGFTETIPYSCENVRFIEDKANYYKKKKEP